MAIANMRECVIVILLMCLSQCLTGMAADSVDCNFDNGFCNWDQDNQTDGFDWSILAGETPTNNTGPEADHTSGYGSYIYIETSPSSRKNQKARLISTEQEPGQYCLSFWYYMYGAHIRTLTIFSKVGTKLQILFSVSNQQGTLWVREQLDLDVNTNYKIVIHARVRNKDAHDLGDIAVDDVVMRHGQCPIEISTTSTIAPTITTSTTSSASTTAIPTTTSTRSTSAASSTSASSTSSLVTVSPTAPGTTNTSSKSSTRTTTDTSSTTENVTDKYSTETSSKDSIYAAIRDKEEDSNIAVYVLVPFAVIVVTIIVIAVVFLCWRRMQMKIISDTVCKGDAPIFERGKILAVTNNGYSSHELEDPVAGKLSDMHRPLSADSGYVAIQDNCLQSGTTADNEYSNIIIREPQLVNVRNDYEHICAKTQHAHNVDEAYSNLAATNNVPNDAVTDMTYSHICSGDQNIRTKRMHGEKDDSYNMLQLVHTELPLGMEHDQDPDYDHAIAGQHAQSDTSEDDYSRLHNREAKSNINDTNGNKTKRLDIDTDVYHAGHGYDSDTMNAARDADTLSTKCVQGVGSTPNFFVPEPEEDQPVGSNDSHYFVLEKLNENCDDDAKDESPYNHDYFVLEA